MPQTIENTQDLKRFVRRASEQEPAGKLTAEHLYLLTATVTATLALATWLVDPNNVVDDRYSLSLGIVAAVMGCGYIVRSAESRTRRLLDAKLSSAEASRRDGYAHGIVAGAGLDVSTEGSRPLRSVN